MNEKEERHDRLWANARPPEGNETRSTDGEQESMIHYDTVRQQCPDCPDGSVWNERGPTDEVCPTCRGEAFVWVKAEPDAAIAAMTKREGLV